jgi:thiol-disulfide isomerase/thioredoxin
MITAAAPRSSALWAALGRRALLPALAGGLLSATAAQAGEGSALRVYPAGLDDCCAAKAVDALRALPEVAAADAEPADGALCLTLRGPAEAALPAVQKALDGVGMALQRHAPAEACGPRGPSHPWEGASGFDFAALSADQAFAVKDVLVDGKVTILEFGAAWCAPCYGVAAALGAGARQRPQVAVRAVSLPGPDAAAGFAAPAARRHLSDAPGIPWIFVYSAKGRLLYAGEDPALALAAADKAVAP